ncbi:MAG: hypothetical protein ACFCVF_05175 [Kineosporiaceae bacterium]
MTAGLLYVAGEAALLLVVALVVGVLLGRFAWPRRRPAPTSAGLTPTPAPTPTTGPPGTGEGGASPESAVGDRRTLDAAERRLWACRTEVTELRATLAELSDKKDLEMARLETAAIEALETTITAHRDRITALEREVAAGQRQLDEARALAEAQRRRADLLTEALAERDSRIADLLMTD